MGFYDPLQKDRAAWPNLLIEQTVRHLACSCDCICNGLLSHVVYESLPTNLYLMTLSFTTLSLSKLTRISMYKLPMGGLQTQDVPCTLRERR